MERPILFWPTMQAHDASNKFQCPLIGKIFKSIQLGLTWVWQTMLNLEDQKHRYTKKSKTYPLGLSGAERLATAGCALQTGSAMLCRIFSLLVVCGSLDVLDIHLLSSIAYLKESQSPVAVHDRPRIAQVQKTASESGPGQAETGRLWMWVLCNQNLWQRRARVVLPCATCMLFDYTILLCTYGTYHNIIILIIVLS